MSRFLYCSCVLLCLCASAAHAARPLSVFVSIAPQEYLVKRIGAELVDVRVMLQAGDAPETFDPSPRQVSALQDAQLYFRIGVPFERKWLRSINTSHAPVKIIDCCDNVIAGDSANLDKHAWTSVRNARLLAATIKYELQALLPAHAGQIEDNYRALADELKQLDRDIIALLDQRRTDYFFIAHAALGHFARDYGLVQVALEDRGREAGARQLAGMIRLAKQEGIRSLFMQAQHPSPAAQAFAREINATVYEIDPLRGDYIPNLRETAALIARAMR